MVELQHIAGIQRFGQHDTVWLTGHDRHQVGQGKWCVQRIDTYPDLLVRAVVGFQIVQHQTACNRQAVLRHRVFQVQQQGVRAGVCGFGQFFLTVARHEQQ